MARNLLAQQQDRTFKSSKRLCSRPASGDWPDCWLPSGRKTVTKEEHWSWRTTTHTHFARRQLICEVNAGFESTARSPSSFFRSTWQKNSSERFLLSLLLPGLLVCLEGLEKVQRSPDDWWIFYNCRSLRLKMEGGLTELMNSGLITCLQQISLSKLLSPDSVVQLQLHMFSPVPWCLCFFPCWSQETKSLFLKIGWVCCRRIGQSWVVVFSSRISVWGYCC